MMEYTKDSELLAQSRKYMVGLSDVINSGPIPYLVIRKKELEESIKKIDFQIEKTKSIIIETEAEFNKHDSQEKMDEMVFPEDTHSAQMLALSAENAAISDILYHLDSALVNGRV